MTLENANIAWSAYVEAEKDRIRDVYQERLQAVLLLLKELPEGERNAWAREFACKCVDEDDNTPVRFPLFREVLFPALLSGMRKGKPGYARWLAGFSHLIYKSPACQDQLLPQERTEIGLLREALRLDSTDALACRRLINAIRWQLEYSVHEVPAGILYGNNCATIEQCHKLQSTLAEFEALAKQQRSEGEHLGLIQECATHYSAYASYLAEGSRYGSYEEYLSANGIEY